MVAEALLDQPVGQFNAGVEVFGIIETVEQEIRPLIRRRQMIARERVDMR